MCLFPNKARRNPEGGRPILDPEGDLPLPCGSCAECISARSVDWAVRSRHEISLHKENCFLTLTYDDEHLPSHICLKEPFQRFIHYLRRSVKKKISYIVSHEYGSQFFRPHHHCLIFGWEPKNQKFLKKSKSGESLFTSDSVFRLWPHGFHSIGTANERSAYYIASYALKGKEHTIVLPNGEIVNVRDSFDCSKNPGIGLNFFKKNYKQLLNSGERLPRYYQKKLAEFDLDALANYEDEQASNYLTRSAQQRLAKFTIADAKLSLGDNEFRLAPVDFERKYLLKQELKRNVLPKGGKK